MGKRKSHEIDMMAIMDDMEAEEAAVVQKKQKKKEKNLKGSSCRRMQ